MFWAEIPAFITFSWFFYEPTLPGAVAPICIIFGWRKDTVREKQEKKCKVCRRRWLLAELNLRRLGVGGSVGDGFEGAEFFHTDFGGSAGVIHFAGAYAFEIEFASGRMAVHMSGAT